MHRRILRVASRSFASMKAMRSRQTLFLQPSAPCRLTRGKLAKSARVLTLRKLAGAKRTSSERDRRASLLEQFAISIAHAFWPEITSFPTNSWSRLKAGERLPQRMSKPRVFVFNPPLRMSNVRRLGLFHCKCRSTILAVSYLHVHRRDAGSCGFWKRANVSSPSALRSSS